MARRRTLLLFTALAALACAAPAAERNPFRRVVPDLDNQPLPPPTAPSRLLLQGNKSYTEEQLREPLATSLQEIEEGGLTRPRADDAAYYLSIYYRKQGFPQAEVAWEIRGRQLVLKIKEGPRTYLNKIIFRGNKTQTTEDLYEYMIGETGERLLRQPERFPFVEADMQTGVARLRGLYESVGRLTTVIADPEFQPSRDGTSMNVVVSIQEGPQFRFGEISFIGASPFSREQLLKALSNPTGEPLPEPEDGKPAPDPLQEPYTAQRANTLQQNLLYFFKLQGYYTAQVALSADPQTASPVRNGIRRVPVKLTLTPGALHRFDGVKVNDLPRLKPSFLQNRFGSLSGQVYNPTVLDERYRQVLRTGLFSTLRLSTVALPSNEVRIDLQAEEAKAKEVGFSIGFSSYEGAMLGLRLSDRNFLGNGRPLSLDVDYSQRAMRGEVLYVDPWWLESNFALRARLFIQTRDEEGYTATQTGLRAELSRKATKQIELTAFAQAKHVAITEFFLEPQFVQPTSYQIATLGFTQSFDYRNNPINPSKGWIINLGLDADAVANELAFGRATARLSYYIPIQKKFLLALGARGGLILPFTSVPINERFFNGGSTSVRSFRERRLGPKDKHGYPIGGEAFTTFNAELTIPLKDALALAVFADAGNVTTELADAGLEELRYALGLGLRYKLPIGPVRLDVGANPAPKLGEPWGAVHFSFGFAF